MPSSSFTNLNRLHFPAKIYLMLENESPDIIAWNFCNATFRIVDINRFQLEIIPKYFRHNQISSVHRQMNLYGFKCSFRGEDRGSYFHPEFRRGEWEAVKKIRRCVSHSQNLLMSVKLPVDASFADSQLKADFSEREKEPTMMHGSQELLPERSFTPPPPPLPKVDNNLSVEIHPLSCNQCVEILNIKLDFKFPSFITITDSSGDAIKLTPMGHRAPHHPPVPTATAASVHAPQHPNAARTHVNQAPKTLTFPVERQHGHYLKTDDFSEILNDLDDILSY